MEMVEKLLTNNPCYKAGKKIKVSGLMLHSVGCPQPSAETFIKNWNNEAAGRACVHAFVDGNTGRVYQTLPWDHRAWHCGGSGNNTYIGVEMCEPACIKYTGGAAFTCSDMEKAMRIVKLTYEASVELFAFLCKKFGLNPLGDGVIISHKEGHERSLASGHGDPEHLWNGLKTGYTMDGFRKAVSEAMGGMQTEAFTAQTAESAPPPVTPVSQQALQSSIGDIQIGDTVGLLPEAVYYNGGEMPDWVKSDKWIVKSVSGDRAVIDKNVSGSRAICSPVSIRFLTVERKAQPLQPPPPHRNQPQAQPQEIQPQSRPPEKSGEMHISDRGVELIARYEGCRLYAYKCAAGVWTIGYGHTAGVREGDTLDSEAAAKKLLAQDLEKYAGYVNACVKKGLITFPLNQNRFDALTSFVYNCGNGSLQKLVSGRDAETVADKLLQYNKGGGKVLAGLTRRREEERALFLS